MDIGQDHTCQFMDLSVCLHFCDSVCLPGKQIFWCGNTGAGAGPRETLFKIHDRVITMSWMCYLTRLKVRNKIYYYDINLAQKGYAIKCRDRCQHERVFCEGGLRIVASKAVDVCGDVNMHWVIGERYLQKSHLRSKIEVFKKFNI